MGDLSAMRVHRPSGRSLARPLILLTIVTVVLAQIASFAVDNGGLGLLFAGFVAFLVIFLLVVICWLARARVEVGADGIHNRVLGGHTHLRWDELADVRVTTRGVMRTVQVVRRDGQVVRLSALRDAPTMPDLGFDETVDEIRQQIAHHSADDAAAAGPATVP